MGVVQTVTVQEENLLAHAGVILLVVLAENNKKVIKTMKSFVTSFILYFNGSSALDCLLWFLLVLMDCWS